MRSRLQLDVRNLNLRRRHLVNAYKVKTGYVVTAGNNTVWSMPERFRGFTTRRYINPPYLTLPYLTAIQVFFDFAHSTEYTNEYTNACKSNRNHLCGDPHYKICLQNHFWVCWHAQTEKVTDTLKIIPGFAIASGNHMHALIYDYFTILYNRPTLQCSINFDLFLFSYSSRALFRHRCWTCYALMCCPMQTIDDDRGEASLWMTVQRVQWQYFRKAIPVPLVRVKNEYFKVSVFALIVSNFERWLPRVLRCATFTMSLCGTTTSSLTILNNIHSLSCLLLSYGGSNSSYFNSSVTVPSILS